jgi:hypothetical protein
MPVTGTSVTLPAGTYHRARYSYAGFVPGANGIIYPGPYFGFKIEERLFLPKPTGTYLYKVSKIKIDTPPSWWTTPLAFDSTTVDVFYGMGADWDVYSTESINTSIDNYGRSGPGTGLTWQEGAAPSPTFSADSNLIPNGHFGFIAHLAPAATPDPFAMHAASNPYAIYPAGGYEDNVLYKMAADAAPDTGDANGAVAGIQRKYFLTDTSAHDSIPTDMDMVVTLAKLSPPYAEKNFVTLVGVTAPNDTSLVASTMDANSACRNFAKKYNKIRQAAGLDTIPGLAEKLGCLTTSCVAKPGDANASGTYTLGDVISIVNYIFNKDGCTVKPLCWLTNLLCRGDWNGSNTVSLSDVIQAVNFIFNKPNGPWNALPSGTCCQ